MIKDISDKAKAQQLRAFFNRYGRIYIVVDATREDVQVPEHLKGDPALRLVLNVRMPQPIYIHDDALESDFSYSGRVFPTRIPMRSIWAAYVPNQELEDGILWEKDMPEGVRQIVKAVRGMEGAGKEVGNEIAKKEKRIRHLRVVK